MDNRDEIDFGIGIERRFDFFNIRVFVFFENYIGMSYSLNIADF
jgi:hypothetical protein